MGSSGSKPRRKKKSPGKGSPQHLPKVGTATENERLLHEEQHAVAAQMGMGNMSSSTKTIALVAVAIVVLIAVLSLIVLMTFH